MWAENMECYWKFANLSCLWCVGKYVLFNNKIGVVVPPGVINKILKKITPIAEYPREGGLYCADMTLSGFTRQGQEP